MSEDIKNCSECSLVIFCSRSASGELSSKDKKKKYKIEYVKRCFAQQLLKRIEERNRGK